MVRLASRALAFALIPALLAACGGDDGANRRAVSIVQADASCTPASIDASPGEKLRFEVRNDGKKDAEVEGIEGTNLEELLIPSGKTRNTNFTAASKAGTQKVKCYVPGGQTTIIQVNVK